MTPYIMLSFAVQITHLDFRTWLGSHEHFFFLRVTYGLNRKRPQKRKLYHFRYTPGRIVDRRDGRRSLFFAEKPESRFILRTRFSVKRKTRLYYYTIMGRIFFNTKYTLFNVKILKTFEFLRRARWPSSSASTLCPRTRCRQKKELSTYSLSLCVGCLYCVYLIVYIIA